MAARDITSLSPPQLLLHFQLMIRKDINGKEYSDFQFAASSHILLIQWFRHPNTRPIDLYSYCRRRSNHYLQFLLSPIHTICLKPTCRNIPVVLFWPTLSAFVCSACAGIQSALFASGEFWLVGKRVLRDGGSERVWLHACTHTHAHYITLYSCCFTSCMEGR